MVDYTDPDPEVDQCPQCFGTVEIKNGCKTRCNNCGFYIRDCSDLA
jgi:hypothetical protein